MARSGQWSAVALAALALGCGGGGGGGGGGDCTGGDNVVCGKVTYDFVPSVYDPGTETGTLDFAHAVQKPVRNGTVRVYQGATLVGSGTTDESGSYDVPFTPSGSGALVVAALSETTNPPIVVQDNTDGGVTWAITAPIGTGKTVKNLRATHGWTGSSYDPAQRAAAPFAVLDTMYTASHAFIAVRPAVAFPALAVNWSPLNEPGGSDPATGGIGTSHYNPNNNQIYILGKDGADTDEFDKEVIAHEWGHFFEHNLSRSDSPGGPHSAGDKVDPRLAFGEGYGDAIASMVLNDPIYSDTFWSGSTLAGFGWDAEHVASTASDPTPGVFSEMKVTELLYDLYDPANESFDQLALGLGPIYDVLTGPEKTTDALTTLGSFIAGLRAQPGVDGAKLDALLAAHGVGPITTAFGAGDADLTAIYTQIASFPAAPALTLRGGPAGYEYNKWEQVQFYVFTGNGNQVTVTASSAGDVGIRVYQAGDVVAESDATTSGTESVNGVTALGQRYVVVITGYSQFSTPTDYDVSLSFTSP
jgi:hypothetical protein